MFELGTKWKEFIDTLGETKTLVLRGDLEDAAVLIALNMPDERIPIPFASLTLGIGKTEYVKWRAETLYNEVLNKLIIDDPNYCVFRETYEGKDYCYKSWKEYWKVFQPTGTFSMLSAVPRGLEQYNKAALLWQEKTKFGEFSNGENYTVLQIIGERWQDAFEDMNWSPQKYEITIFKPEKKEEAKPSPMGKAQAIPTMKAMVENNKVYLGDKVLLDIKDYEPACQGIGEILYAPTDDYFLVILGCFEADNEIILFKADGSDKKQITDPKGWDVVNNYEAEWEKDGKSFIYHRINSFATDPTTFARMGVVNPPKEGMIRYELTTGEKTWIGPYQPPATPTPTIGG
ncbi:hypothetical protein MUP32_06260 [Candidatus Microgenomates bacterium]|nr:hypothetical protein [Candidatus Microgenomates bacterium]